MGQRNSKELSKHELDVTDSESCPFEDIKKGNDPLQNKPKNTRAVSDVDTNGKVKKADCNLQQEKRHLYLVLAHWFLQYNPQCQENLCQRLLPPEMITSEAELEAGFSITDKILVSVEAAGSGLILIHSLGIPVNACLLDVKMLIAQQLPDKHVVLQRIFRGHSLHELVDDKKTLDELEIMNGTTLVLATGKLGLAHL